MSIRQSIACQRLCAIGISKTDRHRILNQVERWKDASGPEWTVRRLKEIKHCFVSRMSGSPYSPAWVSMKPNGIPRGPFGSLFNVPVRDKRRVFRSLSAMMVYTVECSHRVTEEQWKKFHNSVEFPSPAKENLPCLIRLQSMTGKPVDMQDPATVAWSPSRRAPFWDSSRGKTCTAIEQDVERWLPPSLCNATVVKSGFFMEAVRHLESIPYRVDPHKLNSLLEADPGPDSYGKVSFIQEPGYKLRAVANPNRMIQLMLEPLKDELGSVLESKFERDYTFDQDAGVQRVSSWLRDDCVVHTIDLSDATNNFPLGYQVKVMNDNIKNVGLRDHCKLFIEAATGPWRVHDPLIGQEREIRWAKGQPLGLGPSFFLFSMSHSTLLDTLSKKWGGDFCVLGDDVALRGEDLKKAYLESLEELGCPVSFHKCLSSKIVSEFAGRFITSEYALPQLKFRSVSDRSFVDIARTLGPRSLGLLKPRQRTVVLSLAAIPESMGGLGWNPKGLSMADRIRRYRKVISALEKHDYDGLTTLDTREREAANRVLSFGLRLGLTKPVNLELLPTRQQGSLGAHAKNVDQPPVFRGDPRGASTLEVLERKLKDLPSPYLIFEEEDRPLDTSQDNSEIRI